MCLYLHAYLGSPRMPVRIGLPAYDYRGESVIEAASTVTSLVAGIGRRGDRGRERGHIDQRAS